MEQIRVIIADPQDFTRRGICTVLTEYYNNRVSFEKISSKEELLHKDNIEQFHIVLIDYDLLDFSNIDELITFRKSISSIAFLMISDNQSPSDILRLIDGGITNYILKTSSSEELIEAFNAALGSRKYFCSQVLDLLFEHKNAVKQSPSQGKLTTAEIDIVRLIAQGLTTKEIASQKCLSFHTIITHRKNIFRKLGITNSSELLMYAMRTGIVDSTEYYI
jgi:DNA-binding NarL/FixJ family response regulator